MNFKVGGHKINLASIVLVVLLFIFVMLFFDCSGSLYQSKEGFSYGAPLNWTTGAGVPTDTWDKPVPPQDSTYSSWFAELKSNKGGPTPLPEGELDMFYANEFKPECCVKPQQYSASTGCACISESQMEYLNSRGGNRTYPSDF